MMASQLSIRTKLGFHLLELSNFRIQETVIESTENLPSINGVDPINYKNDIFGCTWSDDGSAAAVVSDQRGLCFLEVDLSYQKQWLERKIESPACVKHLPDKSIKYLGFSPQGNFFMAYWAVSNQDRGCQNFHVWRLSKRWGNIGIADVLHAGSLALPRMSAEHWPPVKWRDDEAFSVLERDGSLEVMDGCPALIPSKSLVSIPISRPVRVVIAPVSPSNTSIGTLVLFSPTVLRGVTRGPNDEPAELHVVSLKLEGGNAAIVARKRLDGVCSADSVDIKWSPSKRKFLCVVNSLVDSCGESYEGRSDLYLVDLDWDFEMKRINSKLLQCAEWSPVRDEFIMIEGTAPGEISLCNGSGARIFTFPRLFHNSVFWNPFGTMIALGGFGNLAGDISFWLRGDSGSNNVSGIVKVNQWREACTVLCGWSSCGSYFYTASTRPRMKVDNKLTLWSNAGKKILVSTFSELLGVWWRPDQRVFPPCALPVPTEQAPSIRTSYLPKGSSCDPTSTASLISRYLAGEIKESELPEEVQKKLKRNVTRPNNVSAAARNEKQKRVDESMDWRSDPLLKAPAAKRDSSTSSKAQKKRQNSQSTSLKGSNNTEDWSWGQATVSVNPSSEGCRDIYGSQTLEEPSSDPGTLFPCAEATNIPTIVKHNDNSVVIESVSILQGQQAPVPRVELLSAAPKTIPDPPPLIVRDNPATSKTHSSAASISPPTDPAAVLPAPKSKTDCIPEAPKSNSSAFPTPAYSGQPECFNGRVPEASEVPDIWGQLQSILPRYSRLSVSAAPVVSGDGSRAGREILNSVQRGLEGSAPAAPAAPAAAATAARRTSPEVDRLMRWLSGTAISQKPPADPPAPATVNNRIESKPAYTTTERRPEQPTYNRARLSRVADGYSEPSDRDSVNRTYSARQSVPSTSAGHRASNGQKEWEYLDPKGNVRGPFSVVEMRQWWEGGWFASGLLVRFRQHGDFLPLTEVFPHGAPFVSAPVVSRV